MVYINRRRDKLTEDEIYSIAQMYAEGFSQNYIAEKFYVDRSSVRYHLNKMNVRHVDAARYNQYNKPPRCEELEVHVIEEEIDFTVETEHGRRIDWKGFRRTQIQDEPYRDQENKILVPRIPIVDARGNPVSKSIIESLKALEEDLYSEQTQKPKRYIDYIIDQYKREGKVVPHYLLRQYGRKTM